MSREEFLKQQYLTLRDEIRESKARLFRLLVLGALFVPAAGFIATEYKATFASASIPFIIIVVMLAFISEQNAIVRAGRYLKENVEPHITGVIGWEKWLESNHKLRAVDRYFYGSFLVLFLVFYTIGASTAVQNLAGVTATAETHYWGGAALGYALGGIWVAIVWLRHWHSCTTTTD